jgi:acyl carrier protein
MFQVAESRIQGLVAEQLGVSPEDLSPEVSLTDDLAADSLDLVELALVLEQELGIVVPEAAMGEVRTYGDLLGTVNAIVRAAALRSMEGASSSLVRARLVRPDSELLRTDLLTPYAAETIAEDALRMGRGAHLELTAPATASDARLVQLEEKFAWLRTRGIQVTVRRDEHLRLNRRGSRPHAA